MSGTQPSDGISRNPLTLLKNPAFARVWAVGGLFGVCRWLEMLSLGIWVFDTTASPFLVALLVIMRMGPLFFFGAFVGAIADRYNPKTLLYMATLLMVAQSGLMGILFFTDLAVYWHAAAAALISGLIWTLDMPVRRQYLGDLVGTERIAQAMGLDSATNNATRMLGPLLGGVLYQWLGILGAYGLCFVLYIIAGISLHGLRSPDPRGAGAETSAVSQTSPVQDLLAGLSFARRHREIIALLLVTVIFNIWGFPFTSMIPVIGKEALSLTPSWIGFITSLEGAGAFVGALIIASGVPKWSYRGLYFGGTFVYLILVFVLGWVNVLWAAAALLFWIGVSLSCFSTMQSTLVYLLAPDGMRGRLFGLMVISIGTGLLGNMNIGWMAESYGAQTALKIVTIEGLIALLLVGLYWRRAPRMQA